MQLRIQKQERWVNRKFREMGGENGRWKEIKGRNCRKYSIRQVKSKLRQEYHRNINPKTYILKVYWDDMKKLT